MAQQNNGQTTVFASVQPGTGISYPPTQEQKASVMREEASRNDGRATPYASQVQSAADGYSNRYYNPPTQKEKDAVMSNPIQPAMGISYPPTQVQKASVMSFAASQNDGKPTPYASQVQSAADRYSNRDHTPTQKEKEDVMSSEASKNYGKPTVFASSVQSQADKFNPK